MSQFLNVRRALEKALAAVASIPAIAYDNVNYTPTRGTPFVRASLGPASCRQSTMGANGLRRYEGVFFIDLFYPLGTGSKDAETMAEAITEVFKSGTKLVEGSQSVDIDYCEPSKSMNEDAWFHLPLAVSWYAYY